MPYNHQNNIQLQQKQRCTAHGNPNHHELVWIHFNWPHTPQKEKEFTAPLCRFRTSDMEILQKVINSENYEAGIIFLKEGEDLTPYIMFRHHRQKESHTLSAKLFTPSLYSIRNTQRALSPYSIHIL